MLHFPATVEELEGRARSLDGLQIALRTQPHRWAIWSQKHMITWSPGHLIPEAADHPVTWCLPQFCIPVPRG